MVKNNTDPADGQPRVVLLERRERVAILTINRPKARNAINRAVAEAMTHHLDDLEADDNIWVIVVTGAGDVAFSAGADLKAGPDQSPMLPDGGFAGITTRKVSKPLIAAVNGFALGGGNEICLACDLVVAEQHAQFGLPEVRRGLVAAAGGIERLPRRIPPAIAMEMILTGEPIGAPRALELGLINRVVPAGGAVDAALELAASICEAAPLSVRYSKAVARAAMSNGEEAAVADHRDQLGQLFHSNDTREGRQAFAEKRSPDWTAT